MNKLIRIVIAGIIAVCCVNQAMAKLSEKALANYKTVFLNTVITDNPDQETHIRRYFNGIIREGHAGMRLLDKFGIFLSNMDRKGVDINTIRFFHHNDRFSLFFVLKDRKDSQLYSMFLEYVYGRDGRCELSDCYFSIVFDERTKEIKNFFETR